MKLSRYILSVVLALSVYSCKEDTLDVYNGDNYVHFTPNADGSVTAQYNFAVSGTTRETEVEIPIEIRIWGYLPDKDFTCRFRIDSDRTTALQDDYVEPTEMTFHAGNATGILPVIVRRRNGLLDTDYTIAVVMENADGHTVGPETYRTVTVRVKDDLSGSRPAWWAQTLALGDYSDIKYRVFNIYLGKFLTSISDYTIIEFEAEAKAFRQWWKEQWEDGNYHYYAPDGSTPLYETIPE